jgi:hypothetical protein
MHALFYLLRAFAAMVNDHRTPESRQFELSFELPSQAARQLLRRWGQFAAGLIANFR